MRLSGYLRPLLLLVGFYALTPNASAQDRVIAENGEGMDAHLFRPAIDSKGFFSVNGSGVLGANDISFGLVTDYGRNIMRLEGEHGAPALVESAFQGTFHFNYGLADLAVVGISLPIHLMSGRAVHDIGPSGATYGSGKLDAQNFGSVALHGKVRILPVESGLGLAFLVQAGTATSESMERNLGADKVFYWPQLIVERRFGREGRFRIGANVGYRGHTQKSPRFDQLEGGSNFQYADLVTGGLGVSYRALESLDLVAETYLTQLLGESASSELALSDEVVLGIKVFVERNSYLMLGGGVRTTRGFQAADQRGFIGFIFEPSAEPRYEESPPIVDNSPLVGRVEVKDGDRDGDGIPDSIDQCPDDPEDFDGFEDADGCPDPDNDGDGIPDHLDQCPNEPETFNGFQDDDGCPDQGSIVVEEERIEILDKIQFKTNSAEILAQSEALLDAIATTLRHHPDLVLIEVQGHADERGSDKRNLVLTQDRAASVVDALVHRGIARERLVPMGYGEYCPVDPASNAQAWERNRRVELKVVKSEKGPTNIELGCSLARQKGVVSPNEK